MKTPFVVLSLLVSALPLLAVAATPTLPPQAVTTVELQRFIYQATYPSWCYQAGEAARAMRVKPTTDPHTLHGVIDANIGQCANTSYAKQHASLWNTAVFSASAAALLAARHEPPPAAIVDAKSAKSWSAVIAGYTRNQSGGSYTNNTPSAYRTNAGRINTDAVALLASLQTAPAAAPAVSATP